MYRKIHEYLAIYKFLRSDEEIQLEILHDLKQQHKFNHVNIVLES